MAAHRIHRTRCRRARRPRRRNGTESSGCFRRSAPVERRIPRRPARRLLAEPIGRVRDQILAEKAGNPLDPQLTRVLRAAELDRNNSVSDQICNLI